MAERLTIQMVTWNSAEDLRKSLPALRDIPEGQVEFRFIDNGSEDGSAEMVRQALPRADVIAREVNAGFAPGHNLGFALCRTEFVLILNPDAILNWRGAKQLLEVFRDERIGAVQGKLYRRDRILDSAGIVQTPTLNGKERGAGEEDKGQYDAPTDLLATTGAGCLYRVAALGAVARIGEFANEVPNVFDEDFFAYKEDVDLGWRLNNAGWKVVYEPVVEGTHERSLKEHVLKRLKDTRTRYSLRNYCWMVTKNARIGQLLAHSPLIAGRLAIFFILSLATPALFPAWREIWRGLPRMLAKRA